MSLKNPFDQCGILHNEVLDYLIAQNTSPTYDQFVEYIADFAATEFDDSSDAFKREFKMLAGIGYNYSFHDKTAVGYDLDTLILNSNMVLNGCQLSFLKKVLEPTTDPPTVTYWEDLETEIMESSLRREEMPELLGIVSVAKHSLQYWTDATTDPGNPWYGVPGIQVQNTAKQDYTVFGIVSSFIVISTAYSLATGYKFNRDQTWNLLKTLAVAVIMGAAASGAHAYWP